MKMNSTILHKLIFTYIKILFFGKYVCREFNLWKFHTNFKQIFIFLI